MKLNVGCSDVGGQYKNPEWINIDKFPFNCKNFEVGDPLKGLRFEDNYFEEVHCIHVLEHVEFKDHLTFLKELYRVTKPGGCLYVEVPNIVGTCKQIISFHEQIKIAEESVKPLMMEAIRCSILSIYGKGRWEGDTHRWGFYPEWLIEVISSAGYREVAEQKDMISSHWKQEPVVLVKGVK